jgi:YegS/Rv2252/BmrU family lipid kinase
VYGPENAAMPCACDPPLGEAPIPKPTRIILVPITSMKIRVIVNPSAAAGTAGKKIPELHRLLEQHSLDTEILHTTSPGHATELARQAAASGVDVIAAMGGDGTFSEVSQAYIDARGLPTTGPALALIPAGTGGDFKRSLGLDNDLSAAVRRIARGSTAPLDLGVAALGTGESTTYRAFLNVASLGISGLVCHLTNTNSKHWGGKLTFYVTAVRATLAYRNIHVAITVDGQPFYDGPVYLAALANGRYFGGGMCVAPEAATNDGLLDVVVLGDYSRVAAIGLSRAIYTGAHLRREKTRTTRGSEVALELRSPDSRSPYLVELDGEVPKPANSLVARVHRGVVRLCV